MMQLQVLRKQGRRAQGFSLLEVMIAVAIMGVGMLGVAMMLIQAMGAGRSSRGLVTSNVLMQDAIEAVQRMPWDDVAPASVGGTAPAQTTFGEATWFVKASPACTGPGNACEAGEYVSSTAEADGSGSVLDMELDRYTIEWQVNTIPPTGGPTLKTNVVQVDLEITWIDRTRDANVPRTSYSSFYKFNWE